MSSIVTLTVKVAVAKMVAKATEWLAAAVIRVTFVVVAAMKCGSIQKVGFEKKGK